MINLSGLKKDMEFGFTKEVVLITQDSDIIIFEAEGGWMKSNSGDFFKEPSEAIDSIECEILMIEVIQ